MGWFPKQALLTPLILAWCSVIAQSQTLSSPTILDTKSIAVDLRLKSPVTIDADRMYLGEVLENISAQTGVSVSIPAEGLSSGILITCHLKKVPLADLLNALWSSVGYSKATWQITTTTEKTIPCYQLEPTPGSRTLNVRIVHEADQHMTAYLALLMKMQAMTPKERQANVRQLADAMQMEDAALAQRYVADTPARAQYWSMIGLFTTRLNQEQQAQVLKGSTLSLPLASFSKSEQAVIQGLRGRPAGENKEEPTDNAPDTVVFTSSRRSIDNRMHMINDLRIGIGNSHGMIMRNYLGALEVSMRRLAYEGWILPGDLRNGQAEDLIVGALPILPADSIWTHAPLLDQKLTQFADAQNISYIAVAMDEINHGLTLTSGKSAREFLTDIQSQTEMIHKWRNGVLLLNTPTWFCGDDAQYSYQTVKKLRDCQQHNPGHTLRLPDIAEDVITLTDQQLKRLAREFPEVRTNPAKRPFFVLYSKYPGILATEGLAVDLNMVNALKEMKLMPPLNTNDLLEKIRIVEQTSVDVRGTQKFYSVQFQSMQHREWKEFGNLSMLSGHSASF